MNEIVNAVIPHRNRERTADLARFAPRRWTDELRDTARTLWHWVFSNVHNLYESYKVVELSHLRRLPTGLLTPDHPWATGLCPEDGEPIWTRNVVFASPRRSAASGGEHDADDVIVTRIGRFLSAMVRKSTGSAPEIPQGPKRRMPHAVNYLHGSIHYNGGFLIFNDFLDAKVYLSDRSFVREIRRFAREERRELTLVIREREFDPEEYAWFVTYVRSQLPWWANGNGPSEKRVLWGTPSPYLAVNPINGSWVRDTERLAGWRRDPPIRPPIAPGRYFQGSYRGNQPGYPFLVRFHAWAIFQIISAKGFQSNLAFTSRKRIEPERWEAHRRGEGGGPAIHAVGSPFARRQASQRSLAKPHFGDAQSR